VNTIPRLYSATQGTRIDFRARGATRRQPQSARRIADCHRHRAAAEGAKFRASRGAGVGETVPSDDASPKPTRCSRPCSTDSRQRLSSPRSSRRAGTCG